MHTVDNKIRFAIKQKHNNLFSFPNCLKFSFDREWRVDNQLGEDQKRDHRWLPSLKGKPSWLSRAEVSDDSVVVNWHVSVGVQKSKGWQSPRQNGRSHVGFHSSHGAERSLWCCSGYWHREENGEHSGDVWVKGFICAAKRVLQVLWFLPLGKRPPRFPPCDLVAEDHFITQVVRPRCLCQVLLVE